MVRLPPHRHSGNPVAAGAFEYALFRGGISAGSQENWYLRSTIIPGTAPAAPDPEESGDDIIRPPGPGVAPPTSGATPIIAGPGEVIPLYRIEVPTYSVVPPVARETVLATLGTFHERRGEQSAVTNTSNFSAAWGRVFGQSHDQSWDGTVSPAVVNGNLYGVQAGLDMLGHESDSGHYDVAGLFFGYSDFDADIKGDAVGWHNLRTGSIDVDTTSFGGYWTHIGPSNWYVDAVLMGSWFGGDATSSRDVGVDVDGSSITASLEGGYPIEIVQDWNLEPQAQLIWQDLSLDNQSDRFSDVAFDADNGFTGRLGLRLQGKYKTASGLLQPYLKMNLWHDFSGTDTVLFGSDSITTEVKSTSLELGAGVTHDFTKGVSAFAVADYTFDVDGANLDVFEGNVGLRV